MLFGDYNPAGRLVQSWPRSVDDPMPMMDYDIRRDRAGDEVVQLYASRSVKEPDAPRRELVAFQLELAIARSSLDLELRTLVSVLPSPELRP